MTPQNRQLRFAEGREHGSRAERDRRNARLYLGGLAVSLTGNSALTLVAGIWVKTLTGSSARAGLVSVCIYAPSLAGPLAGLLADRVDRRRLLVATNLGMAVVVLVLLLVRKPSDYWLLYVVMGMYGAAAVLESPAESALFAEIFAPDLRQRLNGWRLGIQETGRVAAPFLGAGLFVLIGGGAVAGLDAASFLIAALATSMLSIRSPAARRPPQHRVWHELTAGVRHIAATPELRTIVVAVAVVMALSGISVPVQYSLVTAVGEPPAFLGVFAGLLGAASVLASLLADRVRRRIGDGRLAAAGIGAYAIGTLLYAAGTLPTALLGSCVFGFALPWAFLAALSSYQRLTPSALQGRVSAAVTLALFGPLAPMQALGSAAIASGGYRQIYLAIAAGTVTTLLWLARRLRRATGAGQ